MRGRHLRRRRRFAFTRGIYRSFAPLRAHPLRFAICSAIAIALFWLVLTKSLPYALATSSPDLALALDSRNPAALIAKARQLRERLLVLVSIARQAKSDAGTGQRANSMANLPEAEGSRSPQQPQGEREALQREIKELATRAVASDPLNAEAYRLLAEAAETPDQERKLMEQAVSLSRRETTALFWLLNDRFYHRDFEMALNHAAILLKTHEELSDYVLRYVAAIAEDEQGLPLVAERLAAKPAWRKVFFAALPRYFRSGDKPIKLIKALIERGSPVSAKETTPYLDALAGKQLIDVAYNAWLQTLAPSELDASGLLTNGNFEHEPSGVPFDWRISEGRNAIAEVVPLAGGVKDRALHVSFGTGRVKFPEVKQIVVLGPGRYRFEGRLRGEIASKRGLRWQMTCATGANRILGETEMLMGEAREWRVFQFDAEVPKNAECTGQVLRLFHDSRSPSEEFITGEIWFGTLKLAAIPNPEAAVR
jgi:hypothetical protein